MKIFFVGVHNKPRMMPLDSKTISGKMIDQIIQKISAECIKTNLFEDEYLPKRKEIIWATNFVWNDKYKPTPDSIIILLGKWVSENFLFKTSNTIQLPHPASCMGYREKKSYLEIAVEKITTVQNLII